MHSCLQHAQTDACTGAHIHPTIHTYTHTQQYTHAHTDPRIHIDTHGSLSPTNVPMQKGRGQRVSSKGARRGRGGGRFLLGPMPSVLALASSSRTTSGVSPSRTAMCSGVSRLTCRTLTSYLHQFPDKAPIHTQRNLFQVKQQHGYFLALQCNKCFTLRRPRRHVT